MGGARTGIAKVNTTLPLLETELATFPAPIVLSSFVGEAWGFAWGTGRPDTDQPRGSHVKTKLTSD